MARLKIVKGEMVHIIKRLFSNYLLVSILFLGLVLRLISINQSFWLDETTTGYIAREFSISSIVNDFSPSDFHPPLFYALESIWSRVIGATELSLRLPSIFFGLLTITLVFMIVGEISEGLFPKIAASLLLATSGLHIYYSQEARMYVMSAFLVAFLVYAFIKTLKSKSTLFFMFFSIALILNFLTDYLPNLILFSFWLYAVIVVRDRSWWIKFILSQLPLLVVFVVWLPYLWEQLSLGLLVKSSANLWWRVLGVASVKEFLLVPVKFILGRISFSNKVTYGTVALGSGLLYAGSYYLFVLSKRRTKIGKQDVMWLWLMVPLIIAFAISFKISVFSYFRLLFILPAFYILAALGLDKLKGKYKIPVFLILFWLNIVTAGIYLTLPQFQREDWRGATAYIKQNWSSSSLVVFPSTTGTEAFRYYVPSIKYSVGNPPSGYNSVWLIRYAQPIFDSEDQTRKNIEKAGYTKQGEFDFNGVVVWHYII